MFSSRLRSRSDESTLCQSRSGVCRLGLCVLTAVRVLSRNQEATKRKATAKVPPKYPPLARQLKLSGKVRVEVIVSPDGRVKGTRILGGNPLLADAALDAIRMWRYETGAKETAELVEIEFKDPSQ